MINRILNSLNFKISKETPIWFMRQAGRYLPEFKKIRKKNPNFVKLCLNEKLVCEISQQPIQRFNLDAVIIFSDILMIPYGLGQKVSFKKNFGPLLGDFDLNFIHESKKKFSKKLSSVYNGIALTKKEMDYNKKCLIGFVGAPWTLLLYMINKKSPAKDFNKNMFLKNKLLSKSIISKLTDFICLHIDNQINAGANVIQIFDSWAGLLSEDDLYNYCYFPTSKIVKHVKKKRVPVICFPRGIKKENYLDFCSIVKPSCINIDYKIDPLWIRNKINKITVQGGLDPRVLLTDKKNIEKQAKKYLNIFSDYPYIFNLGHGILPKTKTSTVDFLVKTVREYTP